MLKRQSHLVVLALSIISVLLVYRGYFFSNKILFSSNLLASFFSPWNSETFIGWEHGIPNKPMGHDSIQFFIPAKKNIVESIRSSSIPLWNPYVFSGAPFAANMQSSFYYPSTFLYLLLAPVDAWSIHVVLVPILCTYFMYLYLRSINLRKEVSLICGLFWSYSSFFAVWNQENPAVVQSSIWLPLILFGIEEYAKNHKKYFLGLSVIGMIMSIFGGHLQFSAYTFIFVALYLFWRTYGNPSHYKRLLVFILLPLLLTAVQLVPAIEAFIHSARTSENSGYLFDIYLVPITHLINIVAPDWEGSPAGYNYFGSGSYYDQVVYVGLIPFIFAISSITLFRKNSFVKFYSLFAGFTLLLGFKNMFSIFLFGLNIPFFSSVIPSRIFYISSFCLLVLAGIGIQRFFQNKKTLPLRAMSWVIGIPLVLLLGGWVYFILNKNEEAMLIKQEYLLVMKRNLLVPTLVMLISVPLFYVVYRHTKHSKLFIYILCSLALLHQYYSFSKNTYFSERQFVYPENQLITFLQENSSNDRVVGIGKAAIRPNVLSYFNLYSPEGLDPMLPKEYSELAWKAYSIQNGSTTNPVIVVSFADLFPRGTTIHGDEPIFSFFNIAGVKYIITHNDDHYTMSDRIFKKKEVIFPFTVWETKSLPRVFLTEDYKVGEFFPEETMKSIIVGREPLTKNNDLCGEQYAEIKHYSGESITIATSSRCESILYLSDTYYPGWKVHVDEQQGEILRANYAFRAVKLPAGSHEVIMQYDPISFKIGYAVSLLTIITMGLWGIVVYAKKT